jgi:hypothetical protein
MTKAITYMFDENYNTCSLQSVRMEDSPAEADGGPIWRVALTRRKGANVEPFHGLKTTLGAFSSVGVAVTDYWMTGNWIHIRVQNRDSYLAIEHVLKAALDAKLYQNTHFDALQAFFSEEIREGRWLKASQQQSERRKRIAPTLRAYHLVL